MPRDPVPNCRRVDENCPQAGTLDSLRNDKGLIYQPDMSIGASGRPIRGTRIAAVQAPNRLEKTASDVIAATMNYRAALERVLAIYERDLARRAELAELRQDLFEREVLSKREFEEGQRAQAEAQKSVDETRAAMAEADRMLTEARMAEALARLTPLAAAATRRRRAWCASTGSRRGRWRRTRPAPAVLPGAVRPGAPHQRLRPDRAARPHGLRPPQRARPGRPSGQPGGAGAHGVPARRGHPVHRGLGRDSGLRVRRAHPRRAALAEDIRRGDEGRAGPR